MVGRINNDNNVAVISPPIITIARGFWVSEPMPLLSAAGSKPRDAISAVIKTGRNFDFAPNSQSVKKVRFTNEETGIDGGKNVNGRKRTILVGTLGLPWSIKVTAVNISDNQASILAVDILNGKVPRLEKITADMGYKVAFKEHIESNYKIINGRLK